MEQTYKIVGIQSGNGYKKLELKQLENYVDSPEVIDPVEALKNLGGLTSKLQQTFVKQRIVDVIRIPDTEFKNMKLEIDGTFTIKY